MRGFWTLTVNYHGDDEGLIVSALMVVFNVKLKHAKLMGQLSGFCFQTNSSTPPNLLQTD